MDLFGVFDTEHLFPKWQLLKNGWRLFSSGKTSSQNWIPRVIWSLIPRFIEVLITSATDALAFLVGATTVLPALSWFCTYAGILSMFDAGARGVGLIHMDDSWWWLMVCQDGRSFVLNDLKIRSFILQDILPGYAQHIFLVFVNELNSGKL